MTASGHIRLKGHIVYDGPSLYADWPAIRLDLEVGFNQSLAIGDIAGLADALRDGLGAAKDGAADVSWERLTVPEGIGRLALLLHQKVHPVPVWFDVRPGERPQLSKIVFRFGDAVIGIVAGRVATWAFDTLLARSPGAAPSAVEAGKDFLLARFLQAVGRYRFDINMSAIIVEAERRNIPWFRIDPGYPIVQLGQGARQRRLRQTFTGGTSALAVEIATIKQATAALLRGIGIPVPKQMIVNDINGAIAAARSIGFPVVVKPTATDRGIAVHTDVGDDNTLRQAFATAHEHGLVLVEEHCPGDDHRLMVVNGRLVAAARRLPAHVMGDGRRSVRQLIDEANRDPRRQTGSHAIMSPIVIDAELIERAGRIGLRLDDVPPAGQFVRLRGAANMSSGGTAEDVTRMVHPVNRRMIERAVHAIGLDIAGVDFVTPDIGKPFHEVGGAICEVNPTPGLRPHLSSAGSPDVVGAIVDALFPNGSDGRIPTAAITGTNGKTTTARMTATILADAGHVVRLCTTDGVWIAGEKIAKGDLAGPAGARMALRDPGTTSAVLEAARGGIVKFGIGFEQCDVAAVLGVGRDHVGEDGIVSREALAGAKSLLLKTATRMAVLNADCPFCVAMADGSRAPQTCWVARSANNPVVAAHVASGSPAVTLQGSGNDRQIVLWRDCKAEPVIRAAQVPATFDGRAEFNVSNAMFATAIAHGLGVPPDRIARSLGAFWPDLEMSSGRVNFIEGWPFQLLIDFAPNAEAVTALCDFLDRMPIQGRRWVVLSSAGNREEAHFDDVAEAAAGRFDRFVCASDTENGRPPAEVRARLAEGLLRAGVRPDAVGLADSEFEAAAMIVSEAAPGDLVVVLASDVEELLARLEPLKAARNEGTHGGA